MQDKLAGLLRLGGLLVASKRDKGNKSNSRRNHSLKRKERNNYRKT
jgi:hypothetical protein